MSQMQILLQCRMHPVQTNEKIKNSKKKKSNCFDCLLWFTLNNGKFKSGADCYLDFGIFENEN